MWCRGVGDLTTWFRADTAEGVSLRIASEVLAVSNGRVGYLSERERERTDSTSGRAGSGRQR
ncbi:hypothetical protein ACFR97_02810 [Haloplanus litoreus]|uniref:Uncharacterized protein n=1 Tax=Haloplanus litoreus TaxID=767515 RepID=A0ABD6A0A2_9EURY